MRVNPFFELYVGDRMSSREFVDIFSPFLVGHAEALFLPGNVVVKGVQGSGKSMLLTLLRPEVRLEYDRVSENFPVPAALASLLVPESTLHTRMRSISATGGYRMTPMRPHYILPISSTIRFLLTCSPRSENWARPPTSRASSGSNSPKSGARLCGGTCGKRRVPRQSCRLRFAGKSRCGSKLVSTPIGGSCITMIKNWPPGSATRRLT